MIKVLSSSISLLKSLIPIFVKLIEKSKFLLYFFKSKGIISPKNDFRSLYAHALLIYSEKASNSLFIKIFEKKSAFNAFLNSTKKQDYSYFKRELNNILITDLIIRKIPELKKYNQVPENDIEIFIAEFNNQFESIQTPIDISTKNSLLNIEKKLEVLSWIGDSGRIFSILQKQIDIYNEQIFIYLNFSTSLVLLDELEKIVEKLVLISEESSILKSQIWYLKGECLFYLNKPECRKALIKAHDLMPHNSHYKELAAISYLKIDEKEKAKTLSYEILKTDPYNPYANSVLKILDHNFELPETIKEDSRFLTQYIFLP